MPTESQVTGLPNDETLAQLWADWESRHAQRANTARPRDERARSERRRIDERFRITFEAMRISILMVLMTAAVRAAPIARDAAQVHVDVDVTYDQPPRRSPRVWVNTRSGVYHCPGSKWYGIGKRGAWMTEANARAKGYRAAYKRACGT